MKYAIDSRLIEPGGIFFALPGERTDGHQFLKEVAEKGAVGAYVSKDYTGESYGLELFPVDDVKKSLQELAKASFAKRKEKVIAVTGSMGKTTTKEFIATLLSAKYLVAKSERSYNSQLTLPLTLLNLGEPADFLVLEMAMSIKGQIERLVRIAPPDVAVLTRIAPASMASFDDGLLGIASAKSEIFLHPRTELGIISAQAAKYDDVRYGGSVPKFVYGEGGDFEMKLIEEQGFNLPFSASHLKENFLAAASVARMMGLSWKEIGSKVHEIKPFEKRFEIIEREGVTFVQDCYNCNPDSLQAALENLPKTGGRTIGVIGTMPDLGKFAEQYHEKMGAFAPQFLDMALCIGDEMEPFVSAFQAAKRPAHFFSDLEQVKEHLFSFIKPGDVVLIKGANSLKLWKILEG